ncbi:uncharacterized protein PHALS_10826 [Plasmopara halstedii]|uniref:Uncharacterized protein n=1 Tax=Plasmopara halstedii TaxID=4781 RepID=A0A0P1AIC1_PLAHL|nr:uncharacterized protein PHALS_10826 [Plasmopara halstedii]CEG40640.1 hypothetical protein PHALS_10826 [Plasmopara halstedii]|eukprot:XP_024577009.1 hypothetical protein PHALS_10826 [Plasmopara halstedii]
MTANVHSIRSTELSETPHFDAFFAPYDKGNSTIGTEHVGTMLLDMGFIASPKVLECALDDMDPHVTGEIAKYAFLGWIDEHADEIDDTFRQSPRHQRQDDGFLEAHSAMLDAKKQRKQAEIDAQLLANRLAHLRAEDARAQKRIEDAIRRAGEIEAMKKRNDAKHRVKQAANDQLQRDIESQRQCNQALQSLSRERRNKIIAKYASQRAQVVKETRAEKKIYLNHMERQREMDRSWLVERSQEIRNKEKQAIRQRHIVQRGYEKELVKKAHDNLKEENKRRLVSEKRIERLESEEAELIVQLRLTQEFQRAAFEELEFVAHET